MREEGPMPRCCEKYDTTFCPECGSRLQNHSLKSLLAHIRKTAGALRKRYASDVKERMRDLNESEEQASLAIKEYSNNFESLEKWLAWEAQLSALIEEKERAKGD